MEDSAIAVTGSALPLIIIIALALIIWFIFRRRKKSGGNAALLLLLILTVSGCSSGARNATMPATPAPAAMPAPAAEPMMPQAAIAESGAAYYNDVAGNGYYAGEDSGAFFGDETEQEEYDVSPDLPSAGERIGEKILQTGHVSMQTDTFDTVVDDLRFSATNSGGFIESANIYGRDHYDGRTRRICNIVLRVPRDQFTAVFEHTERLGKVINSSQSAEDVTARYYDIAGRLETRRVEEERILEMITRAEEIEDLLALEERLGIIRTDIELYQSQMNNIDRLAAFSTINVTLEEVLPEEMITVSDDLGGRLQQAFIRSVNNTVIFFQNVLLFLAEALIPLLFIALLAVVGITIYKRKKKKRL